MAYKESNPVVAHIVVFIILISLLILSHLLFVLFSLSLFMNVMGRSYSGEAGLMASGMGIYFILPKAYLFAIIAFSIGMYKRGLYGKAHETGSLMALLVLILGPIVIVFLGICSFFFEKGYYVLPLLGHAAMCAWIVSFHLFVKDLDGRNLSFSGVLIYGIGSLALAGVETFALVEGNESTLSVAEEKIVTALAVPWTVVLVVGCVFILLAYIKALKWAKTHKPLIDEQQAQQINMQKEQMVMSMQQLEMQKEQLEMLDRTITMLTEMRSELLTSGTELIPERVKPPDESPDAGPKRGAMADGTPEG